MRLRNPLVMDCGIFTTNYREDMAILHHPGAKLKVLVVVAFFLALPFMVNAYYVSVVNLIGIAIIGAIGLNILVGFTGQISIGHGAFMGVGAYAAGIMTATLGWSFWIALPAGGLAAALIGGLFGIPSLRLKGLYLAIATLAAQVIIEFGIIHWPALTRGPAGMVLPAPTIGGLVLNNDTTFYYLILAITIGAVVFALNLFRTRTGRAFMAVRDRDLAASVMGINLFKYKVTAFAVSSFYAGIAGALWGHYLGVISPEYFTIKVSILYLAMIIIGGLGSVMGAIYGACFMTLLPILLRETADFFGGGFAGLTHIMLAMQEAVFGLLIILFLIFEPEGLAKMWHKVKEYFKLWPFSY